jgi:hypothetical protein
MTSYGAEPLGGLDGELEALQRVLVVRGVPPREIEPGDCHGYQSYGNSRETKHEGQVNSAGVERELAGGLRGGAARARSLD